jgi:hypothetical protein
MKKMIGLFSLASLFAVMSCSDKPAKVRKEVIIVPTKTVTTIKADPSKPTTIIVDKNAVKVTTKKVDISVKKQ